MRHFYSGFSARHDDYNAIAILKSPSGFNEALELFVQVPGKKYYASEFLKVSHGGGELEVNLNGDQTAFIFNSKEKLAEQERKKAELLSPEMVAVSGGTFTMGCTSEQGSECGDDERPAHKVTVSDFHIGRYEVTQAQWLAVMGSNPSSFSGCDSCPVEQVSWDDIQSFLSKLNSMTGKNYRLPTEEEWEYAARGGSQSGGFKYSGSNDLATVALYKDNSGSKTHPVGQKSPNELGLYDMSGNVWEWCQDWYGGYSSGSQCNPRGPSSGSYRVGRGGSWGYDATGTRVSVRYYGSPGFRFNRIGFRLAL